MYADFSLGAHRALAARFHDVYMTGRKLGEGSFGVGSPVCKALGLFMTGLRGIHRPVRARECPLGLTILIVAIATIF